MRKIWGFLNGKKTAIAAISGVLLSWSLSRGHISYETGELLSQLLTILTGVAVGHKLKKGMNV